MKKFIPIAVILLLGGGALYLMKARNTETTQNCKKNEKNISGFNIGSNDSCKMRILLETESSQEVMEPVSVVSGSEGALAEASFGKSCYIGPEKWNDKWQKGQLKGNWNKGHEEAQYPGYARYVFKAPKSGDYVLWLRAFWVDGCGNSVDVSINGSAPGGITGSTLGKWVWIQYKNLENDPVRIRLEEGKKNTLTVCNREDDLYFDQILLLGADEPWPDPQGIQK